MKKIVSFLALAVLGIFNAQAQIPTIDVSSLQQLYAQFRVMENQLTTSKGILTESTKIFDQEVKTYETALGDITKVKRKLDSIMNGFKKIISPDAFKVLTSLPNLDFGKAIEGWMDPTFKGILTTGKLPTVDDLWKAAIDKMAKGKATEWERDLALSGYNAKLIQNAQDSKKYGSEVLDESQKVVESVKEGTLIEQAGAQNALINQQTALLNKIKSDINDTTVAEAAERERRATKERNEQTIREAIANIPMQ